VRLSKYSSAVLIAVLVQGCAGQRELTDSQLVAIQREKFDKSQIMQETTRLGTHQGKMVIAEHPCSDVCPAYTVRIVRYDLPLEQCEKAGGMIGYRIVPQGISAGVKAFCVPPVLAGLKEYQSLGPPPPPPWLRSESRGSESSPNDKGPSK
jgi:hypothetical protein